MSDYITEQQQIEQLKEWWKKNGTSTLIVFLIVLAATVGWHFWLKHRENKLERGSTHYEELLNAVVNDDDASTLKEANLLKDNYRYTPYAALAALMIARNDIYQNDYKNAEKELTWVMNHGSGDSLKEVARLRLGRLFIQEKHPQQALDLVQKINDPSYLPMINELKGDSYLALNQIDEARLAYEQALSALPGYALMRPVLVMKLNNLP